MSRRRLAAVSPAVLRPHGEAPHHQVEVIRRALALRVRGRGSRGWSGDGPLLGARGQGGGAPNAARSRGAAKLQRVPGLIEAAGAGASTQPVGAARIWHPLNRDHELFRGRIVFFAVARGFILRAARVDDGAHLVVGRADQSGLPSLPAGGVEPAVGGLLRLQLHRGVLWPRPEALGQPSVHLEAAQRLCVVLSLLCGDAHEV
mmetsp:Transcript_56618/g.127760  ORF Transcript_56618/g.127760 Transcript_56618/m.127760 type:complete len:203 (-) Transcript_56618:258-866(-)